MSTQTKSEIAGWEGLRAGSHDAHLLYSMEQNAIPETIHFWECDRPTVIGGGLGDISGQVYAEACRADGVPVIKRISGGGAVVIGRGCLNYCLLLSLDERPELRSVEYSYRVILGRIVEALNLPNLAIRGTSDIAIGDRKVSGNAQRRGRRALLHHGTFLYDFDISLMTRYLKQPERQPVYRAGRSHADFVTNLPLHPEQIKEAIAKAWPLDVGGPAGIKEVAQRCTDRNPDGGPDVNRW